ncbi:MAG: hypothetical protein NTU59_09895, partial [Coprothermobacterota bacterium]|nr:hypothetical protein [Coprothermobacterota bacterium]
MNEAHGSVAFRLPAFVDLGAEPADVFVRVGRADTFFWLEPSSFGLGLAFGALAAEPADVLLRVGGAGTFFWLAPSSFG